MGEIMKQVLVIGGGPSHLLHFDEVKKFKGKIVCCDRPAKAMTDNGINVDYVVTAEAEKTLAMLEFFDLPRLKELKTDVITSECTRNELLDYFSKYQIKNRPYIPKNIEPTRLPDVGMTAIHWVKNELKPDNILLLGFEHVGEEYDEFTFRSWQGAFFGWVAEWPDGYIINCSEGGALYGKCRGKIVQEGTLKEYI